MIFAREFTLQSYTPLCLLLVLMGSGATNTSFWVAFCLSARLVSETLELIRRLVEDGQVRISEHGYEELAEDGVRVREVLAGVAAAIVLEDYPTFPKGPSVLVLQSDGHSKPIHVVWGIPKGHSSPAILVTAYRPDPARWSADFRSRLK